MEKGIKCCMKKRRSGFQQIYDRSRWDFSIHLTKAFQQAELSVIVHISYTVGLVGEGHLKGALITPRLTAA